MQEDFGNKLGRYRQRARYSQNALAREIGVDPSYINRIEKGERVPSREIVFKISTSLNLEDYETDDLLLSADFKPELADRVNLVDPQFRLMAERWEDSEIEPMDFFEILNEVLDKRRSDDESN